jgi:BNR repeat-containing family member
MVIRKSAISALALLFSLVLAACGGGTSNTSGSPSSASNTSSSSNINSSSSLISLSSSLGVISSSTVLSGSSSFHSNVDSDKDGVMDSQDQCINSPAYDFVDSTGCTDKTQTKIAASTLWQSAPALLDRYQEAHLVSSHKDHNISFKQLAGAVTVEAAPDRAGQQAAHWWKLPKTPSIHNKDVPQNWCDKQFLTLDLYSVVNRGEVVSIGVANNKPNDPQAFHVNDYFLASIRIDWSGWKRISIPLSEFSLLRRANQWKTEKSIACGVSSANGWDKVSGLYFLSKVFNHQPHPNSDFYIGAVWIGNNAAQSIKPIVLDDYLLQYKTTQGIDLKGSRAPLFSPLKLQARWWNHKDAEIRQNTVLNLPLVFSAYYQHERALLDYFPRYEPGYVNFTAQGVPTLYTGGNAIQYFHVDRTTQESQWKLLNIAEVLARYAKEKSYSQVNMLNNGHIEDSTIRFDNDGDIYVLSRIADVNRAKEVGLLLHKSVKRADWSVYLLPYKFARFEKFVGHNYDAFKQPPVIVLSAGFAAVAPTSSYLLLPQKNADGTLTLGNAQLFSTKSIDMIPHSGQATQVLSVDNSVYVVYGEPIFNLDKNSEEFKRGLPTYIKKYDRVSKTFSEAVLIGYGGANASDGHNWPTIAIDSTGILHVIINGHHNPFVYTKTNNPFDHTSWTSPQKVGTSTSYLGLVIDKNDTLYSVSRNTEGSYHFKLSLHRLRMGGNWETKHLVKPFRAYYHVWYHNLAIDPLSGKLVLSYNSQASQVEIFGDEIEMLLYQRPDFSSQSLGDDGSNVYDQRTYHPNSGAGTKYQYVIPSDERAILVSSDGGDSWRLALTPDLQPPQDCQLNADLRCQE